MLCNCRSVFVYFIQIILIVTPVSAAEDRQVNAYKEKQPVFSKFDDKFCLSNDFKDKQVMKVISKLELECRSKEQIKWIFSSPITLKESLRLSSSSLPFTINSTVEKYGSILNGTLNYYFTSILNLKNDHYVSDPNNWTVKIQCGHYQESTLSQFLPTIQVEKKPNKVIQPLDNHKIRREWMENKTDSMDCDPVHLQKNDHGRCSCKSRRGGFVDLHFLACDNLVDCDFLAQEKEGFYGKICPANLVNECNSSLLMSPQLKLNKSGLLYCTRSTGAKIPYVPYLFSRLEMNSSNSAYKEIQILTNNISSYGQFLTISSQENNNSREFSTKSNIHFQCSGPSFIFLKEFRWTLKSENSKMESSLRYYSAPLLSPEDTIVSNLTIQVQLLKLREDVNITIICEGAVRNGHGFVHSNNFTIQLLVPRPVVKKSINCPKNQLIQYKCLTEGGENLKWWNETGQELRTNSEDETSHYFNSCPNYTIICTASKDDVQTSRYFKYDSCQDYLVEHTNCTSIQFKLPPKPGQQPEETQMQWIYIGGGVLGAFLLVFLSWVVVICWRERRYKTRSRFSDEDIEDFMRGGHESSTSKAEPCALFLPYNTALEIPADKLKFESTVLGEGAFGKVIQGKVGDKTVAIKTVNKSAEIPYFKALLSELKIMSYVGKNENMVGLVGACTANIKKREVFVVFEFCSNGNVLEFIRKRRDIFLNQLDGQDRFIVSRSTGNENNLTKGLSSENLIRWSFQVASGMEHVASLNVYHGDLAARNILLSENLVAKIGDFGLSKQLFQYSVYVQRLECPLPLKWLAIESLRDLEFSIQSDVWSYGVTLWELFSLGSTPYPGIDWNFQAWKLLNDGHRMERPDYASTAIHEIMLKCWNANLNERPTFQKLKEMLAQEIDKIVRL